MIEYENSIANWIKQKNKEGKNYHILYRVTPIYNGEKHSFLFANQNSHP